MTAITVTCPACGSDKIAHASRYIVRSLVKRWEREIEHGEIVPCDFGDDELVPNSDEGLDYPYECLGCAKTEMTEQDLLYDGQHHPDHVPEEPAE